MLELLAPVSIELWPPPVLFVLSFWVLDFGTSEPDDGRDWLTEKGVLAENAAIWAPYLLF